MTSEDTKRYADEERQSAKAYRDKINSLRNDGIDDSQQGEINGWTQAMKRHEAAADRLDEQAKEEQQQEAAENEHKDGGSTGKVVKEMLKRSLLDP